MTAKIHIPMFGRIYKPKIIQGVLFNEIILLFCSMREIQLDSRFILNCGTIQGKKMDVTSYMVI